MIKKEILQINIDIFRKSEGSGYIRIPPTKRKNRSVQNYDVTFAEVSSPLLGAHCNYAHVEKSKYPAVAERGEASLIP